MRVVANSKDSSSPKAGSMLGWYRTIADDVARRPARTSGPTRLEKTSFFSLLQDFSTSVINWVNYLQFGQNRERFSLVQFATDATVESNRDVLPAVNSLHYSGGLTDHADAINACQGTFAKKLVDNIILLVTAGVPEYLEEGRTSAAAFDPQPPRSTSSGV